MRANQDRSLSQHPGQARGQASPVRGDATPLMFIIKDASNFNQGRKHSRDVASHVSSRYREWRKTNRKQLALDATTQAILDAKRRKVDGPSFIRQNTSQCTSLAPTEPATEALSSEPSPICSPGSPRTRGDSGHISAIEPDIALRLPSEEVVDGDYRRLTSRLGIFAPTAEHSSTTTVYAWRLFEDFVTPQPLLVGHHSLDPFSSFGTDMDLEVKANLHFYFKVIRPFAVHLINDWTWFDSISHVQSSRVLTYAMAAFGSLFLSGCLKGGPGVVLPPPAEPGQPFLWPMPPWLRLQTICLSELQSILQTSGEVDQACYQAILFLFRISVLLADGPSARIHAKAMRRIGSIVGMDKVSLNTELAVVKVNIISAFLHDQSTVVIQHHPNHTRMQLAHVVELERTLWKSDSVWHAHRGMMDGRVLTWRDKEPSEALLERTEDAIVRLDPNAKALGSTNFTELMLCSQIALFFDIYLHSINCNTSMPRIRWNAQILMEKLESIDLDLATTLSPLTLFNILLSGAVACRGSARRPWFIKRTALLFPDVRFMDDIMTRLTAFIDPYTLMRSLLEEVLTEILDSRLGVTAASPRCLWRKDLPWKRVWERPMTKSPNLSKPRLRIQGKDEPVEVEPEFESELEA